MRLWEEEDIQNFALQSSMATDFEGAAKSGADDVPANVNATTELSYGFDAKGIAEDTSNKGVRLLRVFLALAKHGKIVEKGLVLVGKDDLPLEYKTNQQHVMNCLEMTELALRRKGDRSDITIL